MLCADKDIMNNKNFNCVRCGTCCKWPGYVRVSSDEIDAIAEFMQISSHEFIEKYTRLTSDRRGLSLIEHDNGLCVFYRESPPECVINDVKPAQCRNFPLKWNFEGWEKECRGV